jgi:nucleoside-diphosphate-sugar epimerase
VKRVLVTGATGFLGGALTRRLAMDDGLHVVATGRRKDRGMRLAAAFENIDFQRVDLGEGGRIEGLCKGISHVFHCGALSSPWGSLSLFEVANVVGTRNVIEGCRRHGVERLLYVSSPCVYQRGGNDGALSEDATQDGRPLNHYVATKRAAERLIRSSGLDVISIRPRALFGPGDETLFPRVLRASRRGRFPLIGRHDPLMDCTFVENVVDALLLAAKAPTSYSGSFYNITNGNPMPRSELFTRLFAEVGIPYSPRVIPLALAKAIARGTELCSHGFTAGRVEPVLTRYTVDVLSLEQILDISAAREELGYVPRVTIGEGLAKFGKWWRAKEAGK